jgi:hypothetical protein
MSIYQGLSKLLVQAFLGTLLSSLAITEAIAQAENPLHISNLAKLENCEFLPSLTSLDAEDVYSVDKYVPKTEQEFREIQLFLEKAYLCRSSLQNMGLINSLDQITLNKLNSLNSISQEFILFAADPSITILDRESQLRAGMIPFHSYRRSSFSEITDKIVTRFRDDIGITPPPGFVFIKSFYRNGDYLDVPNQIFDLASQRELQGISIKDRYIVVFVKPESDNLLRAGRQNELRKTISHELVHAYVKSSISQNGSRNLPTWFHEGTAIYFSGSGGDTVLMDSWGNEQSFSDPEDYESYRLAFKYIESRIGRNQFDGLIKAAIETGNTNIILESVGAKSFGELENFARQWDMIRTVFSRVLIGMPIVFFLLWLVIPSTVFESIKEQLHFHSSHGDFGAP